MSGELLDSLIQATPSSGLTSHYNIAGQLLRVQTLGAWETQWVGSFLKGFHLIPTLVPVEDPAITLTVRRAPLPPVPSNLHSFAINRGDCHTDGTHYFLQVDESLIHISAPQDRLVEVWFGLSERAKHPVALVNAFSYGLQAALRRASVFDVHAAGAVEPRSGGGALFVGTSGSGKTTLTLRLTEAGWNYLSDDMVVLRETTVAVDAEGLRRLFAVADTSVVGSSSSRLSAALGTPVASDPTKRRLEPETVFPERRAASCRPRVLFFPRVVAAAETKITEITAKAAMEQLLKHCPWATYDVQTAPDYLRVLARLANQCRAYELAAGGDLLLQPERAADLLAPYLTE
ncbi:MAG TPA: hypothetical protein VJS64_13355 [Pyrinomonadaceae bacterium]|nr:hypothetical protein [Pyrinomonadaceae bacterium]